MNKKVNPYKACIYGLCRDFLDDVGYDLGTKFYCRNGELFTLTMMIHLCYKSRDASEKLFKADKPFLGNKSMRVYSGEALEGKMLVAFAALILRNRMYTKLKDEEERLSTQPNFMNVPAAIRELEKIEMIRQADGIYRLDHAITANQKTILKAFGIDANYVKRKANEISDELNPKVKKVKIDGRRS